jgi:hypothetical protein
VLELDRGQPAKSDRIAAATVTFGGTLTVTNLGSPLQAGDTFDIFDGTIGGTITSTNLPALASTNLFWDFSQFASLGVIKVANSVPPPAPVIQPPALSGTNLSLSVVSQAGYSYVLESTPLLTPSTWTGIATNAGGGTLLFVVPITPGSAAQFFRINVH